MAGHIPSGTVTFLFTDIEGSTRLWEDHTAAMERALERHDEIMREFSTAGDAFVAAFARADQAVEAAAALQTAIEEEPWPEVTPIKVRVGIHTGETQERDGDYFGPSLNRAARICSAGHGGQTLSSSVTAALIDGADLVDLSRDQLVARAVERLRARLREKLPGNVYEERFSRGAGLATGQLLIHLDGVLRAHAHGQ